MPQVSLYIDKPLYMEIRTKAKEKGTSLSNFVSEALREHIEDTWPKEFYEAIGSINDETFDVPEELPWSLDAPRDEL